MRGLRRFISDNRGNTTTRIALAAGAISFVSVLAATSIDKASRDGSLQRMASNVFGGKQQLAAIRPKFPGPYDYTPTGSIPEQAARNVILDPCLGIPK